MRSGEHVKDFSLTPFGIAGHNRATVEIEPGQSAVISEEFKKGDKIEISYHVGGGGGH